MTKTRVLVLEDHAFQKSLAVLALRKENVGVILEATDGSEALEKLRFFGRVDIVICDLRMPGMDGLAFLREAYESDLIGSVILSSDTNASLRQGVICMIEAMGLPFVGELSKPFKLERLRYLLTRYSDMHTMTPSAQYHPHEIDFPEIQRGLNEGEFVAYFQPKVDLCNKKVAGAEVLARWQHPELGLLTPNQFLPAIKSFGLLDCLFWKLLEQGIKLQKELRQQGKHLELALNLDTSQLSSRGLPERLLSLLHNNKLPVNCLMLEVTESGLLEAPVESLENLARLRMMGCGLAMDDFGAGYSSLTRLCELPFNQIKLDNTFIRNLDNRPQNHAIIRSVLSLAKELNISMVVEGVETLEQSIQLQKMGGTLAQGYFFSKPITLADTIRYINTVS